ncbi:bone morphogenetic protein 1-like [Glandiceps talaboti]
MTLYLFTLLSLLCLSAASGEVDDSIGNPCNEDNVIVEGDIAIPQHEYLQRRFSRSLFRRRRAVTNDADKLWPNATIPFEISKHLGSYAADVILQAMDHWEEHTCIHFVPHSDEQDYVEFVKGKCGCCSYVGRRGDGRQLVSLQVFCTFFGVIVHEIGHVIGFWHEHNRPDRDKFVDILYDNVEKHHKVHFEKKSPLEINSFGQAYDYNSIMHYPRKTFSKDGKDTILPLMHNVDIGQREELSESDVIQARELYQCPIPECKQNLTEPTGVIKSPYYPYNYPQNHICEWVIHAPPDHQILLEFQSFDIEYRKTCLFDYLEVRLGTDSSAQLYDIYCGDELPEPIVSKEGGIWLKFHSDETIVKTGFEAKYYIDSLESSGSSFTWSGSGDPIFPIGSGDSAWTTEFIKYFGPHPTSVESTTTQAPCKQVTERNVPECGGFLNSTRGTISVLPDMLRDVGELDCSWLIQGNEGDQIFLNDVYLNIPYSEGCERSYLLVYETALTGITENNITKNTIWLQEHSRFHGKYCNSSPPPLVSSYHQMVIELRVDSSTTKADFRNLLYVSYGIDSDECALGIDDCQHSCHNMVPGYVCNCYHGYELAEDGRNCNVKRVEYKDQCGDMLSSVRGMVSVSSLNPLEVTQTCMWEIRVPDKQHIMLYFTSFRLEEMESCDVYVEFLLGLRQESAGKFCGSILPPMVTLQTSVVLVRFHPKRSFYRDHFQPSFVLSYTIYSSAKERCFYTLKTSLQPASFSSPNYPMDYDNNLQCMWRISAPRDFRVNLKFLDVDIEDTEYCAFDYVAVHDGRHRASVRVGQYCGNAIRSIILKSTGKNMVVIFVSDGTHTGRGFKARYWAVPAKKSFAMHNEL